MSNRRILSELINKSEYFKQLILVSVLIAIGINLITNGILNIIDLKLQSFFALIIGFFICVTILVFMFIKNVKQLNKTVNLDGFILYDTEKKVLLPIHYYKISEDMVRYLNAAFVENKAIKRLWEREPLNKIKIIDEHTGKQKVHNPSESCSLFIELMEYCILKKLSIHLTDYFNQSNIMKDKLDELEKRDIPEVLLDNRFLKLFSEEMYNRELFQETNFHGKSKEEKEKNDKDPVSMFIEQRDNDSKKGKIVSAYHCSGAIYDNFEFILPRNSKVVRIDKNTILLNMDLFSLSISSLFGGYNTVLDEGFEKYYLGIETNHHNIFKFNIEIKIKYKLRSFFSSKRWDYYKWVDNFIEELLNYLDKDTFFRKINWNTVYAIMQCAEKRRVSNKSLAYPPA